MAAGGGGGPVGCEKSDGHAWWGCDVRGWFVVACSGREAGMWLVSGGPASVRSAVVSAVSGWRAAAGTQVRWCLAVRLRLAGSAAMFAAG